MNINQANTIAATKTAELPGGSTDTFEVIQNPSSVNGDMMIVKKDAGGNVIETTIGNKPT